MLIGALGLLPTYALSQGFSTRTSFNIIAILNAWVHKFLNAVLANKMTVAQHWDALSLDTYLIELDDTILCL